jgi:hypothetical protein
MMTDAKSVEAALILRSLSSLPGAACAEETAKRFPRRGPAEPGTGYVQEERSFDLNGLPDNLHMPEGMDEIDITVQGALGSEELKLELLLRVNTLLGSVPANSHWAVRTFLGSPVEAPRPYKINLFTEMPGMSPSA